MAIANFGLFYIEKSELIDAKGTIEYPYAKFSRLRNFTTLQVAAKTREKIELRLILSRERSLELEVIGGLRSQRTLNIGSKNWGKYQISNLSKEVRFGDREEVVVELSQVEQVLAIADFTAQTNVIGQYGLFEIKREELLEGINWELNYPTVELGRLQSFPKVQNAGDDLREISLKLRFDKNYNFSPINRLDAIRALADFYVFYDLVVLGVNYGDFVVKRIDWQYKLVDNIGDALQVDVSVELLQSPTGLPPKLPIIESILINGIQKSLELGDKISSITFEDPLNGNALLEVEFDGAIASLPIEGDTIRIAWKYSGELDTFDTGVLKCDRPIRRYTPDTVIIGAQSLNWSSAIDSQIYISYSAIALNTIIGAIASAFSLVLTSDAATIIPGITTSISGAVLVDADSYFQVISELARDYGYSARLRFDKLYFQSIGGLENDLAQFLLTPTDCLSAEFTTKVRETYSQALFPYKGNNAFATVIDSNSPSGSRLDFRTGNQFWHDLNAAIARSSGELKYYNSQRHIGTIVIEGRSDAIASKNIQLATFDNASDNGKFMILKATHKLSTEGWTTTLEIRKIF